MKYPQSVPMPRDVEDWLVSELEARGIDTVLYTRYILSLLHHHHHHPFLPATANAWRTEKEKGGEEDCWRGWNDEAVKRLAAVMAVSHQKSEVESLVDELCVKFNEMECSAANRISANTPLFATDYYTKWPIMRESLTTDERPTDSVLTRGILRASLHQINPSLPYVNTIQAEDCFSLMYCGSQDLYGNIGGLLSEEAPRKEDVKRLYERGGVSDRLLSDIDLNIDDMWKSENISRTQEQRCLFNYYNLFSPTLFANLGANQNITEPSTTWSLGGVNKKVNESDKVDVSEVCSNDKPSEDLVKPVVEDLLTSARTHFRPIRSDDSSGIHPGYADGTTFQISNDLDQIPYQRSESGTLFLEMEKYLEYKTDDVDDDKSEFVPKFRVQQSNEKCCQTEDDFGDVESDDQVAPCESSESSVSDPDEFYFPGDDALALHINESDTPAEQELELIDSRRLEDNAKVDTSQDVDRIASVSSVDPCWEVSGAALVENIVNDDFSWTTVSDSNSNNFLVSPDVHMESTAESGCKLPADAWPSISEGFWNVDPSSDNGPIKQETVSENKKKDWREIWGLPSLRGEVKPLSSMAAEDGWEAALEIIECIPKILHENSRNERIYDDELKNPRLPSFPAVQDSICCVDCSDSINHNVDWSSFGPFADDLNFNSSGVSQAADEKWPKLNAALSAYLEESRARALQCLDGWGPIDTPFEIKLELAKCRELWNDCEDVKTYNYLEYPDPGLRGLWCPENGKSTSLFLNGNHAMDYCQLRDELTEEGNELLSDINCLQLPLNPLGHCDKELGPFPTLVPSVFFGCNLNKSGANEIVDRERAQKERKRRNSSSQKVCDQYMEGECRRPHCRFLHCDAAIPCPFFADASCLKGDSCPLSHSFRHLRESQRAFTL